MNGTQLLSLSLVSLSLTAAAAATVTWPTLDKDSQHIYDSIFAPRVMAIPPTDAPCGPYVSTNGVLYCFGTRKYGDRVMSMTSVSTDLGLNWTLRPRQDADNIYPECPWADYSMQVTGSGRTRTGHCYVRRRGADGRVQREDFEIPGVTSYGRFHFMPKRKRLMFAFYNTDKKKHISFPGVVYSDDDGRTWSPPVLITNIVRSTTVTWPDKARHWDEGLTEPDVIELRDGSVLMIVRGGVDHHVFYLSKDGGATWGEPFMPPAFWAHNTMPYFLRLADGRLLCIWNNTQPLPEFDPAEYPELAEPELTGWYETVFTNRDALHAAISEDDGKTWIGFREIALNEIRNRSDFRQFGNEAWNPRIDKSIHQQEALELPGGKIAVTYGQNLACARIAIFDVRWLYEKSREDDLYDGLGDFSTQLYLRSLLGNRRGWSGHCALNRISGASMAREPDSDRNAKRESLQICRIHDPRLIDERQGVVWNFPAVRKGAVTFECRIEGHGVRVSLCDHWLNPCDGAVAQRSPFSYGLEAGELVPPRQWVEVSVSWNLDAASVVIRCGDREKRLPIKMDGFSPFGLSYLHLQTLATKEDAKGTYFRWFKMKGE